MMFTQFSAMEKWKKTSYMVAVYLFFIEVRPLEPYLTSYLIGPNGNLSLEEVIMICISHLFCITKFCIIILILEIIFSNKFHACRCIFTH